MKIFNQLKVSYFTLLLCITMTVHSAGPLQLTDLPLFLNQSVPPALAITFDDSGSMSWSWMPDSRSFSRSRPSFASSDYNLIYYNPNIDYPPPVNADGSSMPNSNFSNAKRDGYAPSGMISNIDLRSRYRVFRYYYPNYSRRNYSISYASAGRSNTYNRAFYYEWIGPADASISDRRNQSYNYKRHDIYGSAAKQNFANWYTYYNTRSKLAKAAVSHAFVNFGPDFKIDWQQINYNKFNSGTVQMNTFDGTHRQDFYNWLFTIPGSGSTPLRRATKYAGELFRDSYSGQSVYYDANYGGELTCQQNFHISISDGSWNSYSGITGNRDSGASYISNKGIPYSTSIANNYFYKDVNSDTLADTAFYYWIKDLKTGLDNDVPRFIDDYTDADGNTVTVNSSENWWDKPELVWNPKNDPANWQHMVNFNIGLGIEGSFDRDTDLDALRSGALIWPKTFTDTCFKRDSNGDEVFTSCQNHFCFDGTDTQTANIVDCAGFVAPLGDIRLCINADTNSPINCADRIVRKVNLSQGRVDDVWHASLNSRGDYFSARDPQELASALNSVVSNIIKRKGRASAGSVSSNIISNESLAYKTGYDTSDWSGFVVSYILNENGTLGDVQWDAACKLTGGECATMSGDTIIATNTHATRNIFTYDPLARKKHPFHTVDMSTTEINNILDSDYFKSITPAPTDLVGAADSVIHYVRGDRDYEQQNGGEFRNRRNLLADVIHSSAKVIRGPSNQYQDNLWTVGTKEWIAADSGNGYEDFKENYRQRKNILLVGSNDGMLHAFDAGINSTNGGDELWAYIPSLALHGISEFANPAYKHKSYVDSTPSVTDAYINSSWSSVALGGMRLGGQLVYALDLGSDPDQEPNVLWEFTNKDDNDMGFSYSSGRIGRVMHPISSTNYVTKWIAFVPNGYNSANQKSVLYAIDLETGQVLHKWNTGIGSNTVPNGMGPPVLSDFAAYRTSDEIVKGKDLSVEFVYAGDLYGNVYRFDTSDIFTGNDTIELLYSGDRTRPITSAPRLFDVNESSENITVVFGTGKYLEVPDRAVASVAPQYLFGLRDSKNKIASPYSFNDTRIVEQTLSTQTSTSTRTSSSHPVLNEQSWKMELPETGERMVNDLGKDVTRNLLFVATIIPNGDNPCLPGGKSWFMILDGNTGSTPTIGRLLGTNTDAILINDIVIGTNILDSVGGNQTIISIDGAGSGGGGGTNEIPPILLDSGEKWRRRSWHRIIFD